MGLATALSLGAGVAAHAAADGPRPSRWTEASLPVANSRGADVTRPDSYTTWIAGTRAVGEGRSLDFSPVLFERDWRRGGAWSEVPLPALPAGSDVQVYGIDAASPHSGFIVGDFDDEIGGLLTERRNGSTWEVVPAPVPPGTIGAALLDVDEIAPGNAWAVGYAQILDGSIPDPEGGPSEQLDHYEPVVRHWDGTAWQSVAMPAIAESWYLLSMTAVSARDIWAVGRTADLDPVLVHYDGTAWSAVTVPPVKGELRDIVARGPHDVWAVGGKRNADDSAALAFALHFDGIRWREVPAPAGTGVLDNAIFTESGAVFSGSDENGANPFLIRAQGERMRPMPLPAGTSDLNIMAIDSYGSELLISGHRTEATPPFAWIPVVLSQHT